MSTIDSPASTTATGDSGLAPPDDFGASIMAEFEKRGMEQRKFGEGQAAMLEGGEAAEPPGGWPGGATVDAGALATRLNAAAVAEYETGADGQVEAPSKAGAGEVPPSSPAPGDKPTPGDKPAPSDDPATNPPVAPTDDPKAPPTPPSPEPPRPGESKPGEPTVPAGAPDDPAKGTPTTPGVETPAEDATPAVSAEGAAGGGYTWSEGDQTVTFTDDQVRGALALSAWAEQLPDQTRTAFAAIEQGQAVAIARADYDAFEAWRNAQTKTQRDADLAKLDVDPDVAQVITTLRDEVAALKAGAPAATAGGGGAAPPEYANTHANLDATAQRMDTAAREYATRNQLTEQEFGALFNAAVASQVIPSIAENLAVRNPATGAVIRPADPGEVIAKALDIALVNDPGLHTAVLSRRVGGTTTDATQPSDTAPADLAITAKKARASSVASAPSAAVTPSPRSAAQRTPQEVIAAMEAELATAMSAGTQ